MNYSTSIRNALDGLYTQSIIQHDQVATAHEAYLNDLGNESLKANYFGAVATDNQLHTSIAYYLAQGEQEKTTKLNQAEALNNQVVPANDFETSLRDVNTLRLKRYKGLSYTDLEASNLERIAMKCYEEAGPAVYYARAMLAFIDTTVYNFPTDECSQQRSNPNANGENTISKLNFYPNPLSYDLMISGLSDMKEPVICRVFDMFGRQIMQHTLNGDGSLPFSAVEPGSYVLQVLTEEGQFLSSHKIIKFNN